MGEGHVPVFPGQDHQVHQQGQQRQVVLLDIHQVQYKGQGQGVLLDIHQVQCRDKVKVYS